ncbi:VIT1/CCC1 family predicted Fe2+/Mn2+ transporter [Rhodococcus sp. 27YEA15]|uniref:VIT1/CCC1 transporter family protein n=1 Tax=Rhodococcus sp. 27YEA15 TaxID=3156259 RepID=UPI003C7D82DD
MSDDETPVADSAAGKRLEPHTSSVSSRLNWLRAGVLGADDGIVSPAGLVVGVAAANADRSVIAAAGIAGLVAGAVSFTAGAAVPLAVILLPSNDIRIFITFVAVLVALASTGTISAILGGARKTRAVLRMVIGGAIAMAVTYGIGGLVGTGLS